MRRSGNYHDPFNLNQTIGIPIPPISSILNIRKPPIPKISAIDHFLTQSTLGSELQKRRKKTSILRQGKEEERERANEEGIGPFH